MVEHEQQNVRVPDAAKGTIREIARRLRDDIHFLPRLKRWLDQEADNGQAAFLSERIERLEAKVAALARIVETDGGIATRAGGSPHQVDMFSGEATRPKPSSTSPEGWTHGEGRGRRLTDAGKAELARRIEAGEADREIADALGVRAFTIANQRKAMAE